MLKDLLKKNSMFNSMPDSFFEHIEDKFTRHSYKIGRIILKKGEAGDGFYIIFSGKARVVDDSSKGKPVTLAVLKTGDSFGERSLLFDEPAISTVRAAGNLVLLRLSKEEFDSLTEKYPEFRSGIKDHIEKYNEYNFLKTLNILSDLTLEETRSLIESMEKVHLKKDEFLFHEGDRGDAAYIIREGRIRVVKESAGNTLLAVLKPGDIIGEMSLLHSQPRTAGAAASSEAEILRLHQEIFQEILGNSSKAPEILSKQVTNRLLQQKAFTVHGGDHDEGEKSTIQDLEVRMVRRKDSIFTGTYPIATVDNRILSGIACAAMISRYFNQKTDHSKYIERQVQEGRPDTLISLDRKLDDMGFITRMLTLSEDMLSNAVFPGVIESADGQLAVIFNATKDFVICGDPLRGIEKIPVSDFNRSWNHKLLSVAYVPDFASAGKVDVGLIKRFIPMARPYLRLLVSIFLISIVIQIFGLAPPLFSKVIIDKVLVHGDYSLLMLMLLGMLFITGFQLLSGTLREFLIAHTFKRISVTLLLRFFKHILVLPRSLFSRFDAGSYVQRFQENENFLQLVSQSGFKVIIDSCTILVYLVVLLSMNPVLTGISMFFIMLYAITIIISTPMLRANDRKVFNNRSQTQTFLIENIVGIETVKCLAAEKTFLHEGMKRLISTKEAEFEGGKLGFNISLLSGLFTQANTVAILGFGAAFALKGQITTGDLVAFMGMIGMLLTPLSGLIDVWDEIQQIHISFERINDILKLPPEKKPDASPMPAVTGNIRFDNVSFSYHKEDGRVLSEINLDVKAGQKVALVGRSGSGKTTLVNLLIKLHTPDSGTVYIDKHDIANMESSSLRRQIGVVEQNPYLFSGTIRENIARADLDANLEKVVAAAMLSGAHEFIRELPMGYDTQIGERGITLSGGQRQRLVIARAVLNNPGLLILDEATASLDSESERTIQKNLDELMSNRTTFVIAHRLSTVRNADQIVVLDQGRIVESGIHSELMELRGIYYYLNTSKEN